MDWTEDLIGWSLEDILNFGNTSFDSRISDLLQPSLVVSNVILVSIKSYIIHIPQ